MPRYKKIDKQHINTGQRVRITQRFWNGQPKHEVIVITEGPVVGLQTDGVDTIRSLDIGASERVHYIRGTNHWTTNAELVLPDLPTTPGSVIETEDSHRAAVLRNAGMGDFISATFIGGECEASWQWADGAPGGPTGEQLQTARVIYEAQTSG